MFLLFLLELLQALPVEQSLQCAQASRTAWADRLCGFRSLCQTKRPGPSVKRPNFQRWFAEAHGVQNDLYIYIYIHGHTILNNPDGVLLQQKKNMYWCFLILHLSQCFLAIIRCRREGSLSGTATLMMTFSNQSSGPLSGFAIQVFNGANEPGCHWLTVIMYRFFLAVGSQVSDCNPKIPL